MPTWETAHGRVRGRCRECGQQVGGGRVSWCGDACVRLHRLRCDPNYQRLEVFNRDRGVCVVCGLDCVALRAKLQPLLAWELAAVSMLGIVRAMSGKLPEWWQLAHPQFDAHAIEEACALVHEQGLLKQVGNRRSSYWEMDHVVPLWSGGTNEIRNLRTLCIPCHREATRIGAQQRASQRRQA